MPSMGAQGQLCNFYLPQLVILSVHMAYCSRKKWWSLVGLSTDVGYNKKGTVQCFLHKIWKNALIKHTELCIFIGYHFGTQTLFHWRAVRPFHDASARNNELGLTQVQCMVSSFCCDVDLNCALLGYYALSGGNFLSMFLNNLWVPSSRVKNPRRK
jgi:hypothetical protein